MPPISGYEIDPEDIALLQERNQKLKDATKIADQGVEKDWIHRYKERYGISPPPEFVANCDIFTQESSVGRAPLRVNLFCPLVYEGLVYTLHEISKRGMRRRDWPRKALTRKMLIREVASQHADYKHDAWPLAELFLASQNGQGFEHLMVRITGKGWVRPQRK